MLHWHVRSDEPRAAGSYSNNTLCVPPRPPQLPETLNCILYYSRVEESGGATTVASFSDTGQALIPRTYSVVEDWPIRRSRQHALYSKEKAVQYRPGTVLLYRMDTFHRGTPIKPGAERLTHHFGFKRASAEWMSSNHVVPEVVRAGPEFVVGLSPKQRSVLGIPAVGDRYWNAETVGLLAERYPGIDTAPYAAAGARL